MNDKTTQLRSLIAATDPDGRPMPDPSTDPFREPFYAIAASGDAQEIRRTLDRLLDKIESPRRRYRQGRRGSAVRR